MSRATNVVNPDGGSVITEYNLMGQVKRNYGSRTYPVGYGYDGQGRMTSITNWASFSGGTGTRVTTWTFDAYRGFLTNKVYDGGVKGPYYTYTDAGRLKTRLWARGTNTTYSYNGAGDLLSVVYNDSATAGITNGYDRRGRNTSITNSPTITTLTHNDAGNLLSEAYSGGPLNGLSSPMVTIACFAVPTISPSTAARRWPSVRTITTRRRG